MLNKRFDINPRDTGAIHYMLGARIRQDRSQGSLTVDQTAAITALAERFNCHQTNRSANTAVPMTQEPLAQQSTITDSTGFEYLSAVGSLLHIAGLTRPDIAYAVGVCARHSHAYGPTHIKAVKRIITYLYHTRTHGLVYLHADKFHDPAVKVNQAVMYESVMPPLKEEAYKRSRTEPMRIYADADFAGDVSRRSTSGNVTFLYGGPIQWSSRLQKLYALSTTEAEIYSAVEAYKDAAHLKLQLHELGVRENKPLPVHEDNAACRIMTETQLKFFSKARHYTTRLGALGDAVANGTMKWVATDTKEMIADAFTKPLTTSIFEKFRNTLVHDVKEYESSQEVP